MSCRKFWKQTDVGGRNLCHWCASLGREEMLEWLIQEFKADASTKDQENGYTPLHRAIIHGQMLCAQVLIDSGVGINSVDHEGLALFDLIHKDQNTGCFSLTDPVEVYSCGENMSYNLGHAHPTPRLVLEPVDYFRRQGIPVKKAGQVYACGHGLGGRLGLGSDEPQFHPGLISRLKEEIVDIAAANDHSLFVDRLGNAWACGTNGYKQLGLGNVEEKIFLEPELIRMPKVFKGRFVGCDAGCCHRDHTEIT